MSKRKVVLCGNETDVMSRIKRERTSLLSKYNKLVAFMQDTAFQKLPRLEQELMYHQKFCMFNYAEALGSRYRAIEARKAEYAKKCEKSCKCIKKK